jgi:hypothetical protein
LKPHEKIKKKKEKVDAPYYFLLIIFKKIPLRYSPSNCLLQEIDSRKVSRITKVVAIVYTYDH